MDIALAIQLALTRYAVYRDVPAKLGREDCDSCGVSGAFNIHFQRLTIACWNVARAVVSAEPNVRDVSMNV